MSVAQLRLAAGIVVSSLVHAASTRLLERAPNAGVRVPTLVQFELTVQSPAEALALPARVPPTPPVPRVVRRAEVRHKSDESAAVEQPSPVPVVEPDPAPPAAGTGTRKAIDLSPLAAARTLVDVRIAPSLANEQPRTSETEDTASTSALAEGIPGLSPSGHKPFNTQVRRAVNGALRPWSLPLPHGAYYYDGQSFDAVIREDGSVVYRAKDGPHIGVTQTQLMPKEGPKPPSASQATPAKGHDKNKPFKQMGLAVGLALPDPERWIEWLAGSPRHQLEQRDFLERTRELRERLIEQSTEAARTRAERELTRALLRIWGDARFDLAERMRKTFALWDECADDEVGATMRAQIEAFVRTHCAVAADCAPPKALLRELNAARKSRAPFAP